MSISDEEVTKDADNYVHIIIDECEQQCLIDDAGVTSDDIKSENTTFEDSDSGEDFTGFETGGEIETEDDTGNSKKEKKTKVLKTTRRGRPPKRSTLNSMGQQSVPTTVEEAINGPNSNKWYEAMRMEMQSLNKNLTWYLIDLPPGARAINSK